MADTRRDLIIAALVERLKAVYAKPLQTHPLLLTSELPRLNVYDNPESFGNVAYGTQDCTLTVTVDWANYLKPSDNPRKIGSGKIAEIVAAAVAKDARLDGLCDLLKPVSNEILYANDADSVVGVTVVFEISYQTKFGNPYEL